MNHKITGIFIIAISLILIIVSPVQAYTVNELDVAVQSDGGAVITGSYSLNWGEFIAFSLIGNKEQIAENAIESVLGEDVTIDYLTNTGASVTVPSFAKVYDNDGIYSYVTPALPYDKAGSYISGYMDDYPLLNTFAPDEDSIVPSKTVITFPDGYSVEYDKPYPDGRVPSVTH